MGNPANSKLLEVFVDLVERGRITGDPAAGGQTYVEHMAEAARKILSGVDPDDALHIKRTKGTPPAPHTFQLALMVFQWRAAGEKWIVVAELANKWLAKNKLETVSESALKKTLRENQESVESYLTLAEAMTRFENQD